MRLPAVPFILFAGFAAACGSSASTTSVTAPSGARCGIGATASPSSFSSAGGSATLAINSERECAWSVASEVAWITPEGTSGRGDAVLPFKVAANGTAATRRGGLTIGSIRVEVSQEGAPCVFELDTLRIQMDATAGSSQVRVTTLAGCGWTARSLDPWVNVTGGASGSGAGIVRLSVLANSGPARQGRATVAGRTVTIVQQAAAAPPLPPPPPAPPAPPPPPPPPPPDPKVELEGVVFAVRGSCPDLTFGLNGVTVVADASTQYRGSNCANVQNERRVIVVGPLQPDGSVKAESIAIN